MNKREFLQVLRDCDAEVYCFYDPVTKNYCLSAFYSGFYGDQRYDALNLDNGEVKYWVDLGRVHKFLFDHGWRKGFLLREGVQ